MKFSFAAVLAFAASALAQTPDFDPIYTPASGEVVPAGKTYKITWQAPAKYADEKIAISLIGGDTQNTQVPLLDIVSGIDNSAESYEWAVPADLGDKAFYGLVVKLVSNPEVFQYSNPFKIDGSAAPTGSTSTGSATTTLTASSGVKTVTLSSSVAPETTDVIVDVTTTLGNATTAHVETKTPIYTIPCSNCTTLSTAVPPPAPATPTGSTPAIPTTVPVGAGTRLGASSLAAVVGLVMAAFAL